MNSNTILIRFGISPDGFELNNFEPIKTDKGFLYYIEQSKNGFVLLPPYINYIGNTEENMSNYDLQFIPIDDDGGDLTF